MRGNKWLEDAGEGDRLVDIAKPDFFNNDDGESG